MKKFKFSDLLNFLKREQLNEANAMNERADELWEVIESRVIY